MKVIIIGAGIGGLCLAQRLKQSGIETAVYERDAGPWERPQGYRLHLDADGVTAIRAALPQALIPVFEATSMNPLPYTTIMDTAFKIQSRFPIDEYNKTQHHVSSGVATHLNVNRVTLREILLDGLDDICHWGSRLERFESDTSGVTAHFSNGQSDHGDVLVGADGAGSALRKQRAPEARFMDSGARAIYGRLSLESARQVLPPYALADTFTAAFDARKLILGVGPVIYPVRPDLAAQSMRPETKLSAQSDYVGCIISGRKELFGNNDASLRTMSSGNLQRLAADLLREWLGNASQVPEAADAGSFFYIEMSSSIPFDLKPSANVTLLGDAIHVMTPSLGRGANVALRDANLLASKMEEMHSGNVSIPFSLQEYEAEMTSYGFNVVRQSSEMGARLLGQDPLPDG